MLSRKTYTSIIFCLFSIMLATSSVIPVSAQTTEFMIIDPGPKSMPNKWTASEPDPGCVGTEHFNFSGDQFDKTFFINVTVVDAEALWGWGIGIVYDSSVLQYVSAWRPSGYIFNPVEEMGWTIIAPAVTLEDVNATHKLLAWGCTYTMPDPATDPRSPWAFNGTGTLCQIQFKIVRHTSAEASFGWSPDWTSIYLYPLTSKMPILNTAYFSYVGAGGQQEEPFPTWVVVSVVIIVAVGAILLVYFMGVKKKRKGK